jgi:hypothetical protein
MYVTKSIIIRNISKTETKEIPSNTIVYYTGADTHNYLEGNYLTQLAIVEQYCSQTIHLHTEETPSSQRRFYTRE